MKEKRGVLPAITEVTSGRQVYPMPLESMELRKDLWGSEVPSFKADGA